MCNKYYRSFRELYLDTDIFWRSSDDKEHKIIVGELERQDYHAKYKNGKETDNIWGYPDSYYMYKFLNGNPVGFMLSDGYGSLSVEKMNDHVYLMFHYTFSDLFGFLDNYGVHYFSESSNKYLQDAFIISVGVND